MIDWKLVAWRLFIGRMKDQFRFGSHEKLLLTDGHLDQEQFGSHRDALISFVDSRDISGGELELLCGISIRRYFLSCGIMVVTERREDEKSLIEVLKLPFIDTVRAM